MAGMPWPGKVLSRLRPGLTSTGEPGDVTDFIDEGSELEGKVKFKGTAVLNGKFHGEIESAQTLIIGEKGVVNANIRTSTLIVSGELVGSVVGSQRVELRASARVVGDVAAPVVVIAEGAHFEGQCRMSDGVTDRPRPSAGPAEAPRR